MEQQLTDACFLGHVNGYIKRMAIHPQISNIHPTHHPLLSKAVAHRQTTAHAEIRCRSCILISTFTVAKEFIRTSADKLDSIIDQISCWKRDKYSGA
jgi:hypothetical protein